MLTTIEREAFAYCSCQNLILPNGVTEIPDSCFSSSSLVSIRISACCTSISETAFGGCTALSSITVDPNNQAFKEVNGSLYSSDWKQLVFLPPALDAFVIPKELELISQSLIQALAKVDKITIEDGNKNFSTFDGCLYDFDGLTLQGVCGGVKQLNVSESTTAIAKQACKGVAIESVKFLGEKCATLGDEVFYSCNLLTSFCVPRGLVSIGVECFLGTGLTNLTYDSCSSLSSISTRTFASLGLRILKLPKSLQIIGFSTFQNVYNVEIFELEEGSILSTISTYAFYKMTCTGNCIIVLPTTLTSISSYAFKSCQLDVRFAKGSTLKVISSEAFSSGIQNEVFTIPSSVQTIQSSAFANCEKVVKIEFEENSQLTTIMGSAFAECANLKYLELPPSIESFDYSAISMCFSLTEFTVHSDNHLIYAEGNILYTYDKSEVIVCSPGESNAYVNSLVQSIRSNGFYKCSKLENVRFNSPSKLETISQNTFAECTNLTSISFPVNMRFLLDSAFKDCKKLDTILFDPGSKLEQIGAYVFYGCHSLKNVMFGGDLLLEIGESAFEDCYSLSAIDLPSSVKTLHLKCFKSTGIKSIDLGELTSLCERCFQNCTSLEHVNIESLVSIADYAFEGCTSLKSLSLSPNLEVLGGYSLSNTGLENVTLPGSVERIMSGCFMNSAKLHHINISSTCLEEVQTNSFIGCSQLEFVVYCGTNIITGTGVFPSSTIA